LTFLCLIKSAFVGKKNFECCQTARYNNKNYHHKTLDHGLPTFIWQSASHTRYCGLVCGLLVEKITASDIPNCINYFVVIIEYTQFTNVAAGCGLETLAVDSLSLTALSRLL
jgi:hypothetical protein